MVMGVGRLDIIKIKATIAGNEADTALAVLNLLRSTARRHEIYFCERPSTLGLLPFLDDAVILCIRRRRRGPSDVTVKLRPCRPGQLRGKWNAFRRSAHHELRIKGDWAHDRRVVAASLMQTMSGYRLSQILDSRPRDLGRLFSTRQRRYLAECTATDPDLDELSLLGPVEAYQWRWREPRYDVTAVRWIVRVAGEPSELQFLELSVTAEPDDAALVQQAFLASIRRRGLDPYAFLQTKTRYVLQRLSDLKSA